MERLRRHLSGMDKVVLAYSGGLSSRYLAAVLKEMGVEFVAVTVDTGLLPSREEIERSARNLGIRHEFVEADLLKDRNFIENLEERCYICKRMMILALREFAEERGYTAVIDASTTSDLRDYTQAVVALMEEGVLTPLIEAGISREDVEKLAGEMGIPTCEAETCLATRIPLGKWIRREDIERIRKAEAEIRELGFSRAEVKIHSGVARLRVPAIEMSRAISLRKEISEIIRKYKLGYAALDIE